MVVAIVGVRKSFDWCPSMFSQVHSTFKILNILNYFLKISISARTLMAGWHYAWKGASWNGRWAESACVWDWRLAKHSKTKNCNESHEVVYWFNFLLEKEQSGSEPGPASICIPRWLEYLIKYIFAVNWIPTGCFQSAAACKCALLHRLDHQVVE